MSRIYLNGYRTVPTQEFDVGPFTVLFGKNNVGKTYLLEAIYSVLAPQVFLDGSPRIRDLRGDDGGYGAVYVDLERGLAFDDAVLSLIPADVDEGYLRLQKLPPDQVCFASTGDNDSLPNPDWEQELWFVDLHNYWATVEAHGMIVDDDLDEIYVVGERTRLVGSNPRVRPLFLGWEFGNVDEWVTSAVAELTSTGYGPLLLEPVDHAEPIVAWRVRPDVRYRLNQLAILATDLLPDFLDGAFEVDVDVSKNWTDPPRVSLKYKERGGVPRPLNDLGRGASRWSSIAVQVALHLMEDDGQLTELGGGRDRKLSGNVLFVDEPEAHLHPSAVASVVRWCQRMVGCGMQVVAASHHEEFLRAAGDEVRLVQVSRGAETWANEYTGDIETLLRTRVRTLSSATTPVLHELAEEVGLHPASALSLHKAVLFVEGPLDEAMLDEYAGSQLDAAGVLLIPIHGTKNLEGLIDGEFTTRLGIKVGILTDSTRTETIWDRSNRKRSSEEVKLVRLVNRFQDRGLPTPDLFGVPEDDLLFVLPTGAIQDHLQSSFPGWHELRDECRAVEGLGPSDSADWKTYGETHYGLPLTTTTGVRSMVRALDLAGVELPSMQKVVAELIAWATTPGTSAS